MKLESLLENLYFGTLDEKRLDYRETAADDPVVLELLERYRKIVEDFPPEKIEALGKAPEDLLERLRQIGFFGLIIPKAYGGLGLDLHQYLAVIEAVVGMDMALGILALAHLSIGVKGVLLFGNERQKLQYLPQAASGKMIFGYALTEPLIGSDARNIKTTAVLSDDGQHYVLNGTKTFITNANYSGGLTVFAQMDPAQPGKLGAFIVETAWKGVTRGKDMEKMGLRASSTAAIQLQDVRVPRENLLGQPGEGFKIAMTILNYGRLALGAASSGMLAVSYADMAKRANQRVQFEQPLIHFELVREKILKAYVQKEVVSAMTHLTATLLKNDPVAPIAIESSHCKLYGTNRAWETLYDAMQLAGGSGYLKAGPYEKRMRDFRVATIFEGTTEIHQVYPPLALSRAVMKSIKNQGPLGRLLFFLKAFLSPAAWTLASRHPVMRKSARDIKRFARFFRNLFLRAAVGIGKKLPEKEFLLRRMTTISCYTYGLLALMAKIRHRQGEHQDVSDLLAVLDYYREEARMEVRNQHRLNPDRKEQKLMRVFANLERRQESGVPHA